MNKVVACDLWLGGAFSAVGHWPDNSQSPQSPQSPQTLRTPQAPRISQARRESSFSGKRRKCSSDVSSPPMGVFLGQGNFMTVFVHGENPELVVKRIKDMTPLKYVSRGFVEMRALECAGIACVPMRCTEPEASSTGVLIMDRVDSKDFLSQKGLDNLTKANLLFSLFLKVIESFAKPDQIFFVPDFNVDNVVIDPNWKAVPGNNNNDKLLNSLRISDTVSDLDWSEGVEFALHVRKIFSVNGFTLDKTMSSNLLGITEKAIIALQSFIDSNILDEQALSLARNKLKACVDIYGNFFEE
ncbi:MAG: hypothetical protein EXS67_03495 [Candidatus Margulisbacteria bacterium]|nr:hypothetical protein [Candidatus Margulisiibacteriota bacterium]